jgi:ribosome-binding protein aMBF1 (putative translation factor)
LVTTVYEHAPYFVVAELLQKEYHIRKWGFARLSQEMRRDMDGDVQYQDYPRTLGERIRAARTAKGWSLHELARQAGVERKWIRLLESGERSNASLDIATKLAVALDVTVGYLAGTEDAERVESS